MSCLSGAPPVPLPLYRDPATGLVACVPGFYCPNLDPANMSTYPVYCPPLPDCALDRLFGAPRCKQPQSPFEPVVCENGKYCPGPPIGATNATWRPQSLDCPAGKYCTQGRSTPIDCQLLSVCPAGTKQPFEYSGFVAGATIAVFLLILIQVYHRVLRGRYYTKTAPSRVGDADDIPAVPSPTASSPARAAALATVVAAFRKAAGVTEGSTDSVGLQFRFRDLRVTLPTGQQLLQGVTGHVVPGKVTAIMGPSGAGKTVLFTTLLGKLEPSWAKEGTLLVNGHHNHSRFKTSIGFVPQDDVLHGDLSVAANLYYSSELRLPASWMSEERQELRDAIIELLGLDDVANGPVGTPGVEGLNGGRRKALSIGVELAAAPSAIFLDEPTTGLDATTALSLCTLLKTVAVAANVSVAMVVHQPRVEIFEALDDILVLAPGGRTVYQGPQRNAVSYFEEVGGVTFGHDQNPADVIMDSVAEQGPRLADEWTKRMLADPESARDAGAVDIDGLQQDDDGAQAARQGANFVVQAWLFFRRRLEKQLCTIKDLIVELVVVGVCGLVIGQSTANFQVPLAFKSPYELISPSPFETLLPQLNMYMMMSMGLGASVAGVNVFGQERSNYFRDAQSGCYRVAYFLGTALSSIFRIIIGALTFAALSHGLSMSPIPFYAFFGVLCVAYFAFYACSCAVSIVVSPRDAPLVASTLSILASVFNGFIPFPSGLRYLFAPFWASFVLHGRHEDYAVSYGKTAMAKFGYDRSAVSESGAYAMIFAWGMVYMCLTLVLLLVVDRAKQV